MWFPSTSSLAAVLSDVNRALLHRPYTQRGDIFLNLHPDRLEVVNPGPLPLGVTPQNVLHTTVRRNEHLARLFHDLKLMEREGSGLDRIFEVLLSQGRPAPGLIETHDRVQVTVRRRILKPEIIDFIARLTRPTSSPNASASPWACWPSTT
ncbi:MAG: ATP-binding protein [Sulfurimicrobium sp.]